MSIDWPEYFPKPCPPTDAENTNLTVYRLSDKQIISDKDFQSFKALNPGRDYSPRECMACGLSVYTELSDLLKKREDSPRLRRKKPFKIEVVPESGVIKATPNQGDSHHTWWIYPGVDPKPYCELVEENEHA